MYQNRTDRGRILTQDILPGVAPYIHWLRTPLASLGSAAIASLLCGMFLHPQGFILAFGITGVILVGVIWPKLSVLGLSGSLSFEKSRVREGDRVAVRASVRNRYPASAWGLAIDAGCHRVGSEDLPQPGMAVAVGWKTTEASWDFIPACRGEYPVRPPVVSSGFPFGLWAARRELAIEGTLAGLASNLSGRSCSRVDNRSKLRRAGASRQARNLGRSARGPPLSTG